MFFTLIIAILLGLISPSTANNNDTNNPITTYDGGGNVGGDTGQNPPPKGT